ncbi:DUF2797 domain-containing protein [Pseudomonas sp. PA-3-6H]|uniref:DUF2797 domain-containing protein n=1 Tax=Pseudomonas sp. PA-3-6H TaxID=2665475 RepID=UPI001F254FB9|nr:DUF2797 domain-containing protein [Pseudomonas sp. PA-3-6H]MCF5511986.1 DUF2797 domain-containing protein [Pseudomonas sp. PA-3-6H]
MTLPQEMTLIEITTPGGPEVLQPRSADVPVAGPGEILIRVHAAGVNRPDALQRAGKYPMKPGMSPIPGLEVAGEVVALGTGVNEYSVGDKVCALTNGGGYAQYCAVPASQALPIMRVATRQQSGFVEDLFRSQVADKTNWRALLKGDAQAVDLKQVRDGLFASCAEGLLGLQERFGLQAIQTIADIEPIEIRYPVEQYPTKIVSFNLDKNPIAEGTLLGIKGQYLIFDTGVINIRKYTAYQLAVHQ